MSRTNTGKTSEDKFINAIESLPLALVYRFEDLYDAAKKSLATGRKPSDFLITLNQKTFFAEVKSTNKKSLSFNAISPSQWQMAIKQTKVGGSYIFIIHFLTENEWYFVPARLLLASEKQSINLKELEAYRFDISNIEPQTLTYQ